MAFLIALFRRTIVEKIERTSRLSHYLVHSIERYVEYAHSQLREQMRQGEIQADTVINPTQWLPDNMCR